jgi:tripartite ATP-independent transporter DctP family solute receptor
MKRSLVVLGSVLFVLVLLFGSFSPACAADNPKVGKFGHSMNSSSSYHYAATQFAELVAEKTNGEVIIEIFPDSQLGGERECLEGASIDTIQFGLPGTTQAALYAPRIKVFSLPFLYENREQAYKLLDTDFAKDIYADLIQHNVRVLGFCENGFRNIATRNTPILSPSDLKNLKIRVPDGDLYMQVWTLLGANPTPLAWGELYTALKTGVVDGCEPPFGTFGVSGFGEVCKKYTILNYMYDPLLLVCSEKFYQNLTPEQQKAFDEAGMEAGRRQREWIRKDDDEWRAKLEKDYGLEVFTPTDMQPFQVAVQPIYEKYEDKELLNQLLTLLGRATIK